MKSLRVAAIVTFMFIIYTVPARAQEVMAGIDFQVAVPKGEFADTMERSAGLGVAFMGGYRFGPTPVMLGLELGFVSYGSDTRTEPLSSTIPDLRVEIKNEYSQLHGDILLRLITPNPGARFRPYVDGLVGFNHFYTETILRQRGGSDDDEILRDTNFEDTALRYGFGGGFLVRLGGQISLNIMCRYMFGHEAEYLQEGSISTEGGKVSYDISRSETDLLIVRLGIAGNF